MPTNSVSFGAVLALAGGSTSNGARSNFPISREHRKES